MCGIFAVIGSEPAAPVIVGALKRLEYRGYNSAGIATLDHGHLSRRRAEGKLYNLERATCYRAARRNNRNRSHTLGNARPPNETNAHPHATEHVAVVHNGIIENYKELRTELEADGVKFLTETDTEVVAHLVTAEMKNGCKPVEAVAAILPRLRGAFALAFIFEGEDDVLIGARRGSPLAVGYGNGEMYLGSDAIALAPFTNSVSYLEEGDWVIVRRARTELRGADGEPVHRPILKSTASASFVEKGNHRHFMAKEIHEQPEVVGRTLARYIDMASGKIPLPKNLPFDWRALKRISISACGTAYYAGLVGKYWFERYAHLPVEIDIASEFRYRNSPFDPGNLALLVSQSGETADTLATLRFAKQQKQHVLSIVNVPTSTIARESDMVLPTLAGPEIGVASTKAFTCQLAVLACLAIAAGRARGVLTEDDEYKLVSGLVEVPRLMSEAFAVEPDIERLASDLAKSRDALYLGPRNELPAGARRRTQA